LPRRTRTGTVAPPSGQTTRRGEPAGERLTQQHRRVRSRLSAMPLWPNDDRHPSPIPVPACNPPASSTGERTVIAHPTSAVNLGVDARPSTSCCRTLRRPPLTPSPADPFLLRAVYLPQNSPCAGTFAPAIREDLQPPTPIR
jgi:hypothetical protein